MSRIRMRYKREIQGIYMNYADKLLEKGEILRNQGDLSGKLREIIQKEYEHACKVISTMEELKNLTLRKGFAQSRFYTPLSKIEHIENLQLVIADYTSLYEFMKGKYYGQSRPDLHVKREIEAVNWCLDGIQEDRIRLS